MNKEELRTKSITELTEILGENPYKSHPIYIQREKLIEQIINLMMKSLKQNRLKTFFSKNK